MAEEKLSPDLSTILEKAMRSPSGDNCQPWTFAWDSSSGSETLAIHHDRVRALHRLNLRNSASLLALGTLLESVAIAASDAGYEAEARLGSLGDRDDEPWARVRLIQVRRAPDELSDALAVRATDRRCFRGGDLPAAVVESILNDGARYPGARAHWLPGRMPRQLRELVLGCEVFTFADLPTLRDILRWIRFNKKELLETRDGMPWQGLGVDFAAGLILRGLRSRPGLLPGLKRMGMEPMHKRTVGKQLDSSAGFLCIAVDSENKAALVSAGRLAMRAWLRLNKAGFGVQPLTLASLTVYYARIGALPETVPDEWKARFLGGVPVLREAFAVPDGKIPVWMFRTGISSRLPEGHRTLRRALERCLRDFRSAAPLVLFSLLTAAFSFLAPRSTAMAMATAIAAEQPDQIVRKADDARAPREPVSFQVLTKDSDGSDTKVSVYRVNTQGVDDCLVEQKSPPRLEGRKLLMKGHDLWMYTPNISRPTRISFEQKLTGEVSNGDLMRTKFSGDYSAHLTGLESEGGHDYYKLHLEARTKDATYRSIDYWVEKTKFLPAKAVFYAFSGKPLKTAVYSGFKPVLGKIRMSQVTITDFIQKGKISVLTYSDHKREKPNDSLFSKEALSMGQ